MSKHESGVYRFMPHAELSAHLSAASATPRFDGILSMVADFDAKAPGGGLGAF